VRRPVVDGVEAGDRGDEWLRSGGDHDAQRGGEGLITNAHRPGPDEPAAAADESTTRIFEAPDGNGVIPVAGGLGSDPGGYRSPVGGHLGMAGHAVDAAGLLKQIGGPDHHFRWDARPVRALPPEKGSFDADNVEPGCRQAQRQVFAPGANAQNNDVHLLGHETLPSSRPRSHLRSQMLRA
jgi:hypothetical protein